MSNGDLIIKHIFQIIWRSKKKEKTVMTVLEIFKIITSMLAGLALFLTGMNSLSNSLTMITGGTLNRVIGKVTENRFFAFLFGAVVTALVQSSSAITVLSVGLVNSGMIGLRNAMGLIIGSNLGTTATAWILSLNAIDGDSFLMTIIKPSSFSPFLAIIGVIMTMFCKSEKKKNIGSVLLGFSIMMIGMNLMSQSVSPLREIPAIQNALVSFSNPILGFLFACLFAMLIQSSDAVIGIVQAFAISMGITFGMAIPLVCGAQVGTCITAMLSSLGTSNNGKRTALLNLYYNLLKTIPFLLVFYGLKSFLDFSFLSTNVGGIGIPVFHTLLNLLGTIVWLPLSGVIVALANRTIPLSEKEKEEQANTLTMLDKNLLGTPGIALEQADRAIILLSETIGKAFLTISEMKQNPEMVESVKLLCERAKQYRTQIDHYLTEISEQELSREDRAILTLLLSSNTAFGRMGILIDRIGEMVSKIIMLPKIKSRTYNTSIRILGEAIFEILQLTITAFEARTDTISQTIMYYREEVTELNTIIKRQYIRKIHEFGRADAVGTLYSNISQEQEQLIDYCDMVADALIRYDMERGARKKTALKSDSRTRQQIHILFRDKYQALKETFEKEE